MHDRIYDVDLTLVVPLRGAASGELSFTDDICVANTVVNNTVKTRRSRRMRMIECIRVNK